VSQLFARLCVALYWWHPLVWKAWRECLKEQERAADDMVLNAGESATDYATHLLEIARSLQSPGALASAAVAMARPSQLEGRLSAMLDANRNRQSPQRASAVAASLSAMALLIPVAVLHAQSDTQQQSFETKTNVSAAARAFIDSGKIALSNRDYTKAAGDFEHAAAADAKVTSEADMWAAVTQQRQSNLTAAEGLYQSALAAEAPNSPFAATIMDLYAALLREENRADDAEAMTKRAAGVRSPIAVVEPLAPGVYRIGGNVVSPVLLSKAEPQYSEDARLAKYSGTALLSVEIGTDGAPHNVKIIRGLGLGLDEKAIAAVNRWKFKPGTLNGEPVATRAQIEINFRLL
jgi:TonB family protein